MIIDYWAIGTPTDQLIGKCSKVTRSICKCNRFGWHNFHPKDPKKISNYDKVLEELDDLEARIREFRVWMEVHKSTSK